MPLVRELVKRSPFVLQFATDGLRKDKDLIVLAMMTHKQHIHRTWAAQRCMNMWFFNDAEKPKDFWAFLLVNFIWGEYFQGLSRGSGALFDGVSEDEEEEAAAPTREDENDQTSTHTDRSPMEDLQDGSNTRRLLSFPLDDSEENENDDNEENNEGEPKDVSQRDEDHGDKQGECGVENEDKEDDSEEEDETQDPDDDADQDDENSEEESQDSEEESANEHTVESQGDADEVKSFKEDEDSGCDGDTDSEDDGQEEHTKGEIVNEDESEVTAVQMLCKLMPRDSEKQNTEQGVTGEDEGDTEQDVEMSQIPAAQRTKAREAFMKTCQLFAKALCDIESISDCPYKPLVAEVFCMEGLLIFLTFLKICARTRFVFVLLCEVVCARLHVNIQCVYEKACVKPVNHI